MADRVIIADTRRRQSLIPANEIMQMAGRCGRREGEGGNVNIIAKDEEDIDQIKNDLKNNSDLVVMSVLDSDNVIFHIVSEIVNGEIKRREDIEKWYERSFAYILGYKIKFDKVVDKLIEYDVVKIKGDELIPRQYAILSNIYYFHPFDIYYWKKNFEEIFEKDLVKDNSAIAWCLSNKHSSSSGNIDYYHYLQQFKDELNSINLETNNLFSGLIYWSILNGIGLGKLRNTVRAFQSDFERHNKVFKELFPDKIKFFEELGLRIKFKVGDELLHLLKFKNMSKKNALELYNMGVEYPEDIEENIESIKIYGSPSLISFIFEKQL